MNNKPSITRRSFIRSSSAVTGMAVAAISTMPLASSHAAQSRNLRKNSIILFQGDSITDAGRSRPDAGIANRQPGLGTGYAWLAASQLLVDRPTANLQIYNRGISGNKVFQLIERWQQDCINLRPDLVSVLIGVNDIWHTLEGKYQGTVAVYERDYNQLLETTRKSLPDVRLVVCEPFVLRCGAVNEKWFPEFDEYRAAARRVAKRHKTAWVPFQAIFNEAVKYAPPQHWAADGVHPTSAGASLMAHAWLKTVFG